MVIYIDVLIFTNIIINYCILSLTKKFIHTNSNEWRLIISSVIASFFSLVVFLPKLSTIISLILKLLCSIIICFMAFGYINYRFYIKAIITFFTFTILFFAFTVTAFNIFKPKNLAIINDTVYFHIDSVLLIALSIAIYIIVILIQKVFYQNNSCSLVSLKIKLHDKDFSCIGKIDTGCTLTEPFSNSPVIIVEKEVFKNIKIESTRIIPYNSLGNSGIIYAAKAQDVTIDNQKMSGDIYIGIYHSKIDPDFSAIINHNIVRR